MESWKEELYHHQIKGAKWGVLHGPPYPLRGADKKAAIRDAKLKKKEDKEKKKGQAESAKTIAESNKRLAKADSKKSKADNLAKAREAKAAKKQHEMDKEQALKSGKASDILKFQGEYTNDELQTAITRLEKEGKLREMAANEVKKGKTKVDNVLDKVEEITGKADKAIKGYNTAARVINSLSDTSLPIISRGVDDDQKIWNAKKARVEYLKSVKDYNGDTNEVMFKTKKKKK